MKLGPDPTHAPSEARMPDQAPLSSPRPGRCLRILLVEDFELSRQFMLLVLAREGHEVRLAVNGEEALELLAGEDFDLVFMDLQLPGMDGAEATLRIRAFADPAKACTPVLGLTGLTSAEDRARLLTAGMDEVLTKPLERDELARVLARHADAVAAAPAAPRPKGGLVDWAWVLRLVGGRADDLAAFCRIVRGRLPQEIAALRALVAARDCAGLADKAHALKSTARSFGATTLADRMQELERAGRAGDAARVGLLVNEALLGSETLLREIAARLESEGQASPP